MSRFEVGDQVKPVYRQNFEVGEVVRVRPYMGVNYYTVAPINSEDHYAFRGDELDAVVEIEPTPEPYELIADLIEGLFSFPVNRPGVYVHTLKGIYEVSHDSADTVMALRRWYEEERIKREDAKVATDEGQIDQYQ